MRLLQFHMRMKGQWDYMKGYWDYMKGQWDYSWGLQANKSVNEENKKVTLLYWGWTIAKESPSDLLYSCSLQSATPIEREESNDH